MKALRHPLIAPALALLAGLMAAAIVGRLLPTHSWTLELPESLALRLSEGGERELFVARPAALWLVLTALLPYLVVTARRSLVDLPGWQVALQALARAAVALALALALALPGLAAPVGGKSVVFVVDISESVDDAQLAAAEAELREAIAAARAEPAQGVAPEDRTRLRVVRYAARPRALTPEELDALAAGASLRAAAPDPAELEARLASDHGGALRLAEALLDPETEPRVVLLTDGAGDLAEREQLAVVAARLAQRGIALHTRSFPAAPRGDVIVEGVHLPPELREGQTFEVAVDVVATAAVELDLHLERDGAPNPLEPTRRVTLRPGKQQIKLSSRVTEPGPVRYLARLDTAELGPQENRSKANDQAAVVGEVKGRPRVLYVGNDESGALPRALRADHLAVDARAPAQLPESAPDLAPYDLVILSDISARRVGLAAQRAIVEHVEIGGAGFMMVGGENAYGVGGWAGSPLDGILPVRYEGERQREQPTLALMLVIDKSGSMSSEDKLELVKEAARVTARGLDPSDEIGVVAFDSSPHALVRLQRASARFRISSDIRRLSAGGGTNIVPALREAYLQLVGSRALIKHVILLSDGQSPEGGLYALINDMRDADITVSAVGVGAGAGKDLLARVAQRGRGRYYFSQDGTDVPRIFSRETQEVTRNALVERELYARVAKPVQALRGIDFERAPGLRGIVPFEAKAQAETLLRTHRGDALLVRGRAGLGKTAAFASDAKPRWAAAWVGWSAFPKFWSQVARDLLRSGAGSLGGASITAVPGTRRGSYRVIVDVESPVGFANDLGGVVEVVDPERLAESSGEYDVSERVELQLTAPGRYEAEIRDVVAGQRLLRARLYSDDAGSRRLAAEAQAQVSVPYPPELSPEQLQPQGPFVAALASPDATAEGSTTSVVTSPGDAQGRQRRRPLWPLVIAYLVVPLLLLDLLLRRVALGTRRVSISSGRRAESTRSV